MLLVISVIYIAVTVTWCISDRRRRRCRRCIVVIVMESTPATGLVHAALATTASAAAPAKAMLHRSQLSLVDPSLQACIVYYLRRISLRRGRRPQHGLLQALDASLPVVAVGRHQIRHHVVRYRWKLLLHLVEQLHNRNVRTGTTRAALLQEQTAATTICADVIKLGGGHDFMMVWRLPRGISRHNRPSSLGPGTLQADGWIDLSLTISSAV